MFFNPAYINPFMPLLPDVLEVCLKLKYLTSCYRFRRPQ